MNEKNFYRVQEQKYAEPVVLILQITFKERTQSCGFDYARRYDAINRVEVINNRHICTRSTSIMRRSTRDF